jgi:hypothetical protein
MRRAVKKTTDPAVCFHREVLEGVHTNSSNTAYRCLFVDRTDLLNEFYQRIGKNVEKVFTMSISATAPDGNVSYFSDAKRGAPGEMVFIPWAIRRRHAGCNAIPPSLCASSFRAALRAMCSG